MDRVSKPFLDLREAGLAFDPFPHGRIRLAEPGGAHEQKCGYCSSENAQFLALLDALLPTL